MSDPTQPRYWQKMDGTIAMHTAITDADAARWGWTEMIPKPSRDPNTVYMELTLPKPDITDPAQLRFVAAFIQQWGAGHHDFSAEAMMMCDEAKGIEQSRAREGLIGYVADALLAEMQLHDVQRGQFTVELDKVALTAATVLLNDPTLSIERND